MNEPIGLKDRGGREIRVGDIVEFFFCADCGGIQDNAASCSHPPTRCVDEVTREEGEYWFRSPGCGAARAWRYAHLSRVIGTLPDDVMILWEANPDGAPREEVK